ncbi:MAG: hypothetical protein LBD59_00455 [Prevotellaceae bacterium]|nr:hypothetical protein [Prevotellaceae bacterium]
MKHIVFYAILLACVTFAGCELGNEDETVLENYEAKDFIDEFSVVQKRTLNTSNLPDTVITSKGSKFIIQPGTFTKNGNPITGDFAVEIKEIHQRSEIIFNLTNTNHVSGKPLLSDGFFHINATQNGENLDKTLANPVRVEMKTNTDRGYSQLWQAAGEAGNDDDSFAWEQEQDGTDNKQNFLEGQGVFMFDIGKLGWFNCDIYWEDTAPKTTVTVNIGGMTGSIASLLQDKGGLYVFFCAKGDNVVAQFYSKSGPNSIKSYDDSMPIGKEGKIFVVMFHKGKFYYGMLNITISADMSVTVNVSENTKDFIQQQIAALDNFN